MDLDIERPGDKGRVKVRVEAWVRVLELKAATSWCQNFPAEGHFRDSTLGSAIRDGGSHWLRGVPIDTDELAGSGSFKNDLFQDSETWTPRHSPESSRGTFGVDGRRCGDGVGAGNEVSARGANPLISLCIPW